MSETQSPPVDKLRTLGQLAEQLDVSTHQLKYAIDSRGIKPAARVGILRLWSEDDLPRIQGALRRIKANRRGVL